MPDIEYIALLNTKVGILQAENQRLRELLRRLAYIYIDGPGGKYVCGVCYSDKDDDHADDCELAKELSGDTTMGG
jgi:hypothetical protein